MSCDIIVFVRIQDHRIVVRTLVSCLEDCGFYSRPGPYYSVQALSKLSQSGERNMVITLDRIPLHHSQLKKKNQYMMFEICC